MKHCPYCNTDYKKTEAKCPSCQAADFEIRCANCTIVYSTEFCPNCGLDVNETFSICSNCGKKYKGLHCPDCIDFRKKELKVEMGKQEYSRNQAILASSSGVLSGITCKFSNHDWLGCKCKKCGETRNEHHSFYPIDVESNIERCSICGITREIKIKQDKKASEKTGTIPTIILLFVFPPIGILLTWVLQKTWDSRTKIIVSIASMAWMAFLVFAPSENNSYIIDDYEPKIIIAASSSDFEGENYQNVITELKLAGFTNIETKALSDLITGWLVREGSVNEISINGENSFESGSLFPINSEIIITHHSFPLHEEQEVEEEAAVEIEQEMNEEVETSLNFNIYSVYDDVATLPDSNTSYNDIEEGGIVQFGYYYWLVLDVQDDYALIITKNIIERRYFHNSRAAGTWATSDIRRHLNSVFFNSFSAEDRGLILETNVETEINPWYGTASGINTIDRVFLLSIEEVLKYFGNSGMLGLDANERTFLSDQYDLFRIAYDIDDTALWWWTRSPGGGETMAATIRANGVVDIFGRHVFDPDIRGNGGVRPALRLDIRQLID